MCYDQNQKTPQILMLRKIAHIYTIEKSLNESILSVGLNKITRFISAVQYLLPLIYSIIAIVTRHFVSERKV